MNGIVDQALEEWDTAIAFPMSLGDAIEATEELVSGLNSRIAAMNADLNKQPAKKKRVEPPFKNNRRG